MDKTFGRVTSISDGRCTDQGEVDNAYSAMLRPETERSQGPTPSGPASRQRNVLQTAAVRPAQQLLTETEIRRITVRSPCDADDQSFDISKVLPPFPCSGYGRRGQKGTTPNVKQSRMRARRGLSIGPTGTTSAMGDADCFATTAVDTTEQRNELQASQNNRHQEEPVGTACLRSGKSRAQNYEKRRSRASKSSWSSTVVVGAHRQPSGKRNRAMDIGLSTSKCVKPPPGADYNSEFNSIQVSSAVTLESSVYGDDDGADNAFRAPAQKRSLRIDISFAKGGMDEDKSILNSITTNVERILGRLLSSRPDDHKKAIEGVHRDTMADANSTKRSSVNVDMHTRSIPEAIRPLAIASEIEPGRKLQRLKTSSEDALVMNTEIITEPPAAGANLLHREANERLLSVKSTFMKTKSLGTSKDVRPNDAESSSLASAIPSAVPSLEKQHQRKVNDGRSPFESYKKNCTTVKAAKKEKGNSRNNSSSKSGEDEVTTVIRRPLTIAHRDEEALEKKSVSRMQRKDKPSEDRSRLSKPEVQPQSKNETSRKKQQSKGSTATDDDRKYEDQYHKEKLKSMKPGQAASPETTEALSIAEQPPGVHDLIKSDPKGFANSSKMSLPPIKHKAESSVASLSGTSAAEPDRSAKLPMTAVQPFKFSTRSRSVSSVRGNEKEELENLVGQSDLDDFVDVQLALESTALHAARPRQAGKRASKAIGRNIMTPEADERSTTSSELSTLPALEQQYMSKKTLDKRPFGEHPQGNKHPEAAKGEKTRLEQLNNQPNLMKAFPGPQRTAASLITSSPLKAIKDSRAIQAFGWTTDKLPNVSGPRRGIAWSTKVSPASSQLDYGDESKPLVWSTNQVNKRTAAALKPLTVKSEKKKKRKNADDTGSGALTLQLRPSSTERTLDTRGTTTTSTTKITTAASNTIFASARFLTATTAMSEPASVPPGDETKALKPKDQNGELTKTSQQKRKERRVDQKVKKSKKSRSKESERSKKGKSKDTKNTQDVRKTKKGSRNNGDKGDKTVEKQKVTAGEARVRGSIEDKREEATNFVESKVEAAPKVTERKVDAEEKHEDEKEGDQKLRKEAASKDLKVGGCRGNQKVRKDKKSKSKKSEKSRKGKSKDDKSTKRVPKSKKKHSKDKEDKGTMTIETQKQIAGETKAKGSVEVKREQAVNVVGRKVEVVSKATNRKVQEVEKHTAKERVQKLRNKAEGKESKKKEGIKQKDQENKDGKPQKVSTESKKDKERKKGDKSEDSRKSSNQGSKDKKKKEDKTMERKEEIAGEGKAREGIEEVASFVERKLEKAKKVTERKSQEDEERKGAKERDQKLGMESESKKLKEERMKEKDKMYKEVKEDKPTTKSEEDRKNKIKKSKKEKKGKKIKESKTYIGGKEAEESKPSKESRKSSIKPRSAKLKSGRKIKKREDGGTRIKKDKESTSTIKSRKRRKRKETMASMETKIKHGKRESSEGKKGKSKKCRTSRKHKDKKDGKDAEPDVTSKGIKRRKGSVHKESRMKVVVRQHSNQTSAILCLLLAVICFVIAGILLLLYFFYFPIKTESTATAETVTTTMPSLTTGYTTPLAISSSPSWLTTYTPHPGATFTSTTPGGTDFASTKTTVISFEASTRSQPSTSVRTQPPATLTTSAETRLPTVSTPVPRAYLCSTSFCIEEGSYLKSLLSTGTKPCDDFYGYVCDAWIQKNPVTAQSVGLMISRDTLLQDSLAQQVLGIMRNASDPDVLVATQLQSLCEDRSKAGRAVAYVRRMFSEWSIGEWPVPPSSKKTIPDAWTFAAELIRDINLATIAVLTVGINPADLHGSILELDMPQFLFSKAENNSDDVRRLFQSAINETAKAVDAKTSDYLVNRVMTVFRTFGSIPREFRDARRGFDSVPLKTLREGPQIFLKKLFPASVGNESDLQVVLKSPRYFRKLLPDALYQQLPPGDVLNYMGFIVLVEVAPFFPDGLRDLRGLFAKSVLGRAVSNVSDTSALCLRAVEKLLPGCFSKASWLLLESMGSAQTVREWIAQLESIFIRRIRQLTWFDELSALLVRYRLKRHPVTLFGASRLPCAPSDQINTDDPLRFYFLAGKQGHDARREAIIVSKTKLRDHFVASELDTRARYDPSRMTVRVPMALLNLSVSPKSTMFAFHLSRFAVRFYGALVQVLSENFYERDVPMSFRGELQQEHDHLIRCLTQHLQEAKLDGTRLAEALFNQALALQLSLKAFHELLHVRRIWNLDFRFTALPELSADQLFFVYYAFDNCESTDAVYDAKLQDALPARDRVNLALRQLDEFSAAFKCRDPFDQPSTAACQLFADTSKTKKGAKSRRQLRPHSELMSILGL